MFLLQSLCGAVLVFLVGLTTLVQAINGVLTSSDIGLAISYILMVNNSWKVCKENNNSPNVSGLDDNDNLI